MLHFQMQEQMHLNRSPIYSYVYTCMHVCACIQTYMYMHMCIRAAKDIELTSTWLYKLFVSPPGRWCDIHQWHWWHCHQLCFWSDKTTAVWNVSEATSIDADRWSYPLPRHWYVLSLIYSSTNIIRATNNIAYTKKILFFKNPQIK